MTKNYYDILGLSQDVSQDEIKRAYRKLAHKHHPDMDGGDEKKFKEINEAYQILGNPEKRSQYDQYGSTFEDMRSQGGFSGFEGFRDFSNSTEASRNGGRGFSFNFGNLGDIFEDLFSSGGPSEGGGNDISIDTEIEFSETATGVQREIEILKNITCPECFGNGAEPGTPIKNCPNCGGTGQERITRQTVLGAFSQIKTCPQCQGAGNIASKKCGRCQGRGILKAKVKIKVNIPQGIDEGEVIRLTGQGEAGLKGASPGDLFIRIHIKKHPQFRREGNNIYYQLSIHFTQAVLGGRIEVPTLYGPVSLKIPAGIESGRVIKLRGKGIPELHGSGKGDQLVEVIVKTPRRLSRKQKKIIEDLKKEGM